MKGKEVIVIGAGAAGIFAAVNIAALNPDMQVTVLEKSPKLLSKVKVSGGGRCNVTNVLTEPRALAKNYPRGHKKMSPLFSKFGSVEIVDWFAKRGVKLHAESDGRMFPTTNSSQTIIDCLLQECHKYKIQILSRTGVEKISKKGDRYELLTTTGQHMQCDKLVVAAGGSNKPEAYGWLESLGHSIEAPVPSLFTFNLKDKDITALAGISVPEVLVKIAGTKLSYSGPLLVTHWGFSGPAVLKLSAWGARVLQEKNYEYTVLINWLSDKKEPEVRNLLEDFKAANPLKKVAGNPPFALPKRLWEYLTSKSGIDNEIRWNNFSGKNFNRLVNNLVADEYAASGKTTFKEEFVTCGGIKLNEVDLQTMESRLCPNLHFAGEILNIDGITGGFNFQAAWTTAYLAAQSIAEKGSAL